MSFLNRLVRRLCRLALSFYYSEIEIQGLHHFPARGPTLIVANHHISMVDPLLLLSATRRNVRFVAKAPLFKTPILGRILKHLGCIPAYRQQDPGYAKEKNEALYEGVIKALMGNSAVSIFPEGRSHTEPGLAELRHGAAKMAFEAESRSDFHLSLKIQPVGIHFEQTRLFRGKILLTYGPPISVGALKDSYVADPRVAVEQLTQTIQESLSKLILSADDHETLRLVDVLEEILPEHARGSGLKEKFDRKKYILEEYRRLRESNPVEIGRIRNSLLRYSLIHRIAGIKESRWPSRQRSMRLLREACSETMLLLSGSIPLAIGLLMNVIPYWVVRGLAVAQIEKEGRGDDVRAGVGLIISIFIFPVWYALLTAVLLLTLPLWLSIPLLIAGPTCGLLAADWFEHWRTLWGRSRALWISISRPGVQQRLDRFSKSILEDIGRLQPDRPSDAFKAEAQA